MEASIIRQIKEKVSILSLITTSGKQSNKSWVGFCPFHENIHTPAFVVWETEGRWRCFGECNTGGDVIDYVMRRDGLSFHDAVTLLGNMAGIEIEDDEATRQTKAMIARANEIAVEYYEDCLKNHPESQAYLEKRGLAKSTIADYRLGFADGKLHETLWNHGIDFEQAHIAGLVAKDANGAIRDRMMNRVIFPIMRGNHVIGFGGRVYKPNDNRAKFINSPATMLFDKSSVLYGWNYNEVKRSGVAVLVEGYFDTLLLHQNGFKNTCSAMGTAITQKHLRLISSTNARVILALDSDVAGEKAVLRGLSTTGDRDLDVVNLVDNSYRNGLTLNVVSLPEKTDPDDFVLTRGASEWQALLDNAIDIVDFVINAVSKSESEMSPAQKQKSADLVMEIIQRVNSAVARDVYIQHLASRLKISESSLTKKLRKQNTNTDEKPSLSWLFASNLYKNPPVIWFLDRYLRSYGIAPFSPSELGEDEPRIVSQLVYDAVVSQDDLDIPDYIASVITHETETRVRDYCERYANGDPLGFALSSLLSIRIARTNQELEVTAKLGAEFSNTTILELLDYRKLLESRLMEVASAGIDHDTFDPFLLSYGGNMR